MFHISKPSSEGSHTSAGPQGPKGVAGPAGPQGPKGVAGPAGPAGPAGASVGGSGVGLSASKIVISKEVGLLNSIRKTVGSFVCDQSKETITSLSVVMQGNGNTNTFYLVDRETGHDILTVQDTPDKQFTSSTHEVVLPPSSGVSVLDLRVMSTGLVSARFISASATVKGL